MTRTVLALAFLFPITARAAAVPPPIAWAPGADAPPGWPHPAELGRVLEDHPAIGTPISVEGFIACTHVDCRVTTDVDRPDPSLRLAIESLDSPDRQGLRNCSRPDYSAFCTVVVYGHVTSNGMTAERIRWLNQ